MESGELMLKIHDECLILNIYKSMHSSSGARTCMKINSADPASTKPPKRSGKTIGNNSQDKESAKDFRPSHSQLKEKAAMSPIPAEDEKKKEPVAYMPMPPYPQRLKAENDNKAPKKESKEEKEEEEEGSTFIINKGKQSNNIHALRQDYHMVYVSYTRITWPFCLIHHSSRSHAFKFIHH
ncbi:hypothetical protein PIB30_100404 [Stylosanthes scabra]|uniref:Uncharacterized protein n=1 Tax=Stylosanthes scabra TaxID=79078 RepID=A0ABU6XZI7_9FABA|nr:hypothetical protein [Stylosanthes scabra]